MKNSENNQNKPINYHSGHRERMREKFDVDNEMTTFRDHELLEFLLNTVIPRKDTNQIAHELISNCGSLYNVFNEPVNDLLKVKNMTINAAYLLASITPIMRRCLRAMGESDMKKIVAYGEAADYFHTYFIGRNTECLCVLYMDAQFKVVKTELVDELSPVSVSINIRRIASTAVKLGAIYVMVGHNHPSGSPIPSENDLLIIWDLFNALAGIGVTMLDNFIFVGDGFLSFRNVGIITKFIDEYKRNNPNVSLKEDNMKTSLYLSNLKQYLIDVTKLKEENMVELVTVQDFINQNKIGKNDPRVPADKPKEKKKSDANTAELASEIRIAPNSGVKDIYNSVKSELEPEVDFKFNKKNAYVIDYDNLFKTGEVISDEVFEDKKSKEIKKKYKPENHPVGYLKKDFNN